MIRKMGNDAPPALVRGFTERNTERPRSVRGLKPAVSRPRMYNPALLFFVVFIIGVFSGCGPREQDLTSLLEEQNPPEEAKDDSLEPQALIQPQQADPEVKPAAPDIAREFIKPTEREIQRALKNSGLYKGDIDGKIGPLTIKAIKEFQLKHNLKVDAKVGPNTWNKLKEYLNIVPAANLEIGG